MKDDTIVVACATLKQELNLIIKNMNLSFDVEWIDSGLHSSPDKLRVRIQEIIDNLSPLYKTVLLLIGFCGNSLVGIKSKSKTLVVPLVADCIPMLLGKNKYCEKISKYTYFFTSGYLNSERTFISEFEEMKKRYGNKRAAIYTKKALMHYEQLSVIDTGAYAISPVLETVSGFAGEMDLPVNVVMGELSIICNLLLGNWDESSFLIVAPNSEISFSDSLRANNA